MQVAAPILYAQPPRRCSLPRAVNRGRYPALKRRGGKILPLLPEEGCLRSRRGGGSLPEEGCPRGGRGGGSSALLQPRALVLRLDLVDAVARGDEQRAIV